MLYSSSPSVGNSESAWNTLDRVNISGYTEED